MTHLGFSIINLTSNRRITSGMRAEVGRERKGKWQSLEQISQFLLTLSVGLGLRSSPPGGEEADVQGTLVCS
jgi:hypothetical protein